MKIMTAMQSEKSSMSTPQPSHLQRPDSSSASGTLTPSELAQLRQKDSDDTALLREEFPNLKIQ